MMSQVHCARWIRWAGLLAVLWPGTLGKMAPLSAAEQPAGGSQKAYYQEIAQAQNDLDAGRIDEAKKRLAATQEAHRGIEFDYLQARARHASEGQPAPDLIQKLPRPEVESRYGVLNENSRQLVYICRDGSLHVHDLSAPDEPGKVHKHPGDQTIWSGAFSHDGKVFVSGHQNGDVLVWNSATWELRHTVPLGAAWAVRELAVSPDGSSFVAENEKELELWTLGGDAPKKVAGVGERYNFGEGLAFSPKGDLLATGGMFDVILHDAKTGKPLRSMSHASYTMGLEFSPDGKRIASAPRGNVNKFLAVFEVNADAPLFNAGPFHEYIAGLAFTPDGKRIVATGCDKIVRIFDAATGDLALSLPRAECSAKPAVTRDGKLFGWNEFDCYRYIDLQAPEVTP